ncbi:MAG TPA: lycopene beta-cyclase CrtY [Kofleriaceae bacterium]|nr:lycopene beta-cyclase CrtY [Kofleriaceae bacterium]
MPEREFDYALVGGGLQNSLVAMALAARAQPPRIALVERDERLGGNHTWCFHEDDVPTAARSFVASLVTATWSGHEVRFPTLRRVLGGQYSAITSTRLDEVVRGRFAGLPGSELYLGRGARAAFAHRVELEDGEEITAKVVIDARGPEAGGVPSGAGFQKFLGLELELARPHGLDQPLLMDATVPQLDGYRFVYVLPLSPTRALVEDTYFSDSPVLDREALRERVLAYARAQGFEPVAELREETGVLPMPWRAGGGPRPQRSPLVAGYQGGWFHPATGYSLPVAVRLAALVGALPVESLFGRELAELARHVRRQSQFFCQLNQLLFRWFAPAERWQVLARFYHLPEATIRRFYSLDLGALDRARILVGRPPRGLSLRARLAHRPGGIA